MTARTGRCSHRPVWTFIEMAGGLIHPAALEMLGGGRRLADRFGVESGAVTFGRPGRNVRDAAMEAVAHGADMVCLIEDPRLVDYRGEACGLALSFLIDKYRPRVLLLGATAPGRHLAGRLRALGPTADCAVHTVSPMPGPMPTRHTDRAGHIVIEPMPALQGDVGPARRALLVPERGAPFSGAAVPNH
jgi:electron transfer flavoprotein alpha subunit